MKSIDCEVSMKAGQEGLVHYDIGSGFLIRFLGCGV